MIATVKNSTTVMPRTPRRDSTCEAPLRGKRGGSRVGAPLGLQRKHPCCGEQGVCRRKVQRGLVRPARLPNGTAGRAPQQVAAGWPCQQGGLGPRAPDRQGPSTTLTGSVSPLLRGRFHHRRCSPRSDCTDRGDGCIAYPGIDRRSCSSEMGQAAARPSSSRVRR